MTRITRYASRIVHHDLTLVVAIMTLARLLAIIALRPGGYVAETGPDSAYHFQLGRLAASGAYPFVDYWTEYPPLFPWLSVVAYRLAELMPAWLDQRWWFNLALHALIVPFDALNAILVYALSKRASGAQFALRSAWLYATLFVPMFVVLGWFESIALFAALLGLWLILNDRPLLAGIALGLGALVKPYVVLIGAVGLIHLSTWRKVGILILAAALALLLAISPLLIASPQMVKAHVDTLLTLPGWSSPYALIDGVIKHTDPRLSDRFDPALASRPIVPSQVPWAFVTLGFALVYGVVLYRAYSQPHARAAAGLAGFTFVMYLLWSKGYSPQWSLYLMAFLCILMPNLRGVLMLLVLEALYVIEWPITFILLGADASYLTALVVVRTLVMVGLGALFVALIFVRRDEGWERLRKGSMVGGLAALAATFALAAGGLPLYAAQRYQKEPMREAVELIRAQTSPDRAHVLFDRVDTYERLRAYLPGWSTLAALHIGGEADAWSRARVDAFAHGQPELWFVMDFGAEQHRNTGESVERRLSEALCTVSRQFAGSARVTRYANRLPAIQLPRTASFDNGIALSGVEVSGLQIRPGEPLCIELRWTATRTPATDYTVFVHLLDAEGRVVAQSDLPPGGGFAPTSAWPPGETIVDRHGLIAPTNLTQSAYRIMAGMYDVTGARLKTMDGQDAVVLSDVSTGD